jgi:endonuclease YncB( thermonuclease family)
MNQVRLRTVRNMETGKELTISSSKAKELIREGWIEVRPEPLQQHAAPPAAGKRKGFWRWLFG